MRPRKSRGPGTSSSWAPGSTGRTSRASFQETGIPYVLVDIDPERVAEARREGLDALRADATGPEGLAAAGVARALGLVVTIPDPDACRRVVRLSRMHAPSVRILVRTRYVKEVETLRGLGADEVIPEEFETSIELVARVLRLLHVPGNVVATQIRLLRDEAYRRLRDPQSKAAGGRRLAALVAAGTSELFLVLPDAAADGRLLSELDLAAAHVAVPAVLRDGVPHRAAARGLPRSPRATRSSSSGRTRTSRASSRASRRRRRRPRLRVDSAPEAAQIGPSLGVAREGLRSHPGT